MRNVLLLTFCVVLCSTAAAMTGSVELRVDDRELLPGVPTGVSIVLDNRSDLPLQVPGNLWLVATDGEGSRFVLQYLGDHRPMVVEETRLTPRESRELRYEPMEPIMASPWFLDSSIYPPGEYLLEAVFTDEITPDGSYDEANSVTSSVARLNVSQPRGADAAVWAWMRETDWQGKDWLRRPAALAEYVQKENPDSKYALYTAFWVPEESPEEKIRFLESLVERYSAEPFTRIVRLILASSHAQEFTRNRDRGNLAEASAHLERAHSLVEQIGASGPGLEERVAQFRATVPTVSQWQDALRQQKRHSVDR